MASTMKSVQARNAAALAALALAAQAEAENRAPTKAEVLEAIGTGDFEGQLNVYAQFINGRLYIRPGESIRDVDQRPAKPDPDNGYDASKKRSKRLHLGVGKLTFAFGG